MRAARPSELRLVRVRVRVRVRFRVRPSRVRPAPSAAPPAALQPNQAWRWRVPSTRCPCSRRRKSRCPARTGPPTAPCRSKSAAAAGRFAAGAVPGMVKAGESGALEATSSSTRGSGWALSGPASRLGAPSQPARRRASRPRALPRGALTMLLCRAQLLHGLRLGVRESVADGVFARLAHDGTCRPQGVARTRGLRRAWRERERCTREEHLRRRGLLWVSWTGGRTELEKDC